MSARPAIFIDRDGTLIEERAYPRRIEDVVAFPGVGRCLGRLRRAGYLCLLLTNQSAVARGMLSEEQLAELHEHLAGQLFDEGGALDAIYYCPHHPEGSAAAYARVCDCRKPAPGLLKLACNEHEIDLSRSVFVGDAPRDLFPGEASQAARVLVRSGHALPEGAERLADAVVDDFAAATNWILERAASEPEPPIADAEPTVSGSPELEPPAQGT